ncbi:GUN4 domain-containing protein [Nostoc sp. CALU 546]|uniref:GUN4 domain-containing protein n=1 Tax=Nostoc sp. CALU 546 TaxID=1867241 RepID=UPI003B685EDC
MFQLLKEILEVLEFVHDQNNENRQSEPIIHRDIKPANIMRRSQDGKIVLIDFGAVKEIINNNSGTPTAMIGTPGYMPPEQIEGQPRRSSDIFAVGMIGFQALTGENPWSYYIFPEKPEDKVQDNFPRYSDTGKINWETFRFETNFRRKNLANIIDKMTYLDTKKRYQTANEVIKDLNFLLAPDLPENYVDRKYQALKCYLEEKNFREADRETVRLILKSVGREQDGSIRIEDIDHISSEVLSTINKLWQRHSDGKFGFSTQYEIWCEIKRNLEDIQGINEEKIYEKFIKWVGWDIRILFDSLAPNKIKFGIDAPIGHLPIGIVGINPLTLLKRYLQGFGLKKTIAFIRRFEREFD